MAERERTAAHKKQFALSLHLTGLIKVRELQFFKWCNLLIWMGLVIEFDCIMDVLYHLFFDFPVGFDQVKKLGAVMHVFCFNDRSLVSFYGFVVPCFLS